MIHYTGKVPCLLFGHGLLGHAVHDALRQTPGMSATQMPYDWSDAAQRRAQRDLMRARLAVEPDLSIIWTAGRAGFGAEAEELVLEHRAFRELVSFAAEQAADGQRVHFLLTSSAGGLFEGQEEVGPDATPTPLRPYGTAKLRQETELQDIATSAGFSTSILRPTSVFGYARGSRLGLISALIMNTLQGGTTPIYGSLDTRRDYISAEDVGAFIAARALDPHPATAQTHLLGRGRSHSIAYIVSTVATALGRTPDLTVQAVASNAAHMGFAPSTLPTGWSPSPIADGITTCADAIRGHLGLGG